MGCGERRQTFNFEFADVFAIVTVRLAESEQRDKEVGAGDFITDTGVPRSIGESSDVQAAAAGNNF
jgi:hypothetical protein